MLTRLVTIASILVGFVSTARAWEPDPTPHDAPPECITPVGARGLSKLLQRGPELLGTYRLVNGKPLDTPLLRIKAYGELVPDRVGATTGEVQARFEASLLPDVVRDGANPENTELTSAPGSLRLGPYHVTTRILDRSAKPLVYEATVERIGCTETATHPPLGSGEQVTLWMSTEGVKQYRFSLGQWWDVSKPVFFMTFNADLDPDVQQRDTKMPHGYAVFDSGNGSIKYEDSKMVSNDRLRGAKFVLHGHAIEILDVIYGKDTIFRDGRVFTNGKAPIVSILVRVTRM